MQYREFGNTGIKLSILGVGTMRLPIIGDDYGKINESEAVKMIRYAIDNGVNYIDTAFMYHDGNSEIVIGKALKDGYREKTYLADKLALWGAKSYEDLNKVFNTQLERLQTDCIEFYLIHCLNKDLWGRREGLQLLKWCDNIRKSGKIKYLGFSFHDDLKLFKEIIESYNWDFCQIQYNYMNEDVQAGTAGLKFAASKGLPVMIMEPLLGGALAAPSEPIQKIWDDAGLNPVETALRWLWNKPEITVVLGGMSSFEQTRNNIEYASGIEVNSLDKKSEDTIKESIKAFNQYMTVPCTKCMYCLSVCPKKIDVSHIFSLYNLHELKTNIGLYTMIYSQLKTKADECIKCGKCLEKCPQGIKIPEYLSIAHKALMKE